MKKAMLKKAIVTLTAAALCLAMTPAAALATAGDEASGAVTLQEEPGDVQQGEENEEGTVTDTPDTEESGEQTPAEQSGKSLQEEEGPQKQAVPAVMPQLQNVSRTTITVRGVTGVEYSIDGGKTIRKPEGNNKMVAFTGLKSNTAYVVINRTSGTVEKEPSDWTTGTTVKTLAMVKAQTVKSTKNGSKLNYSQVKATRGESFVLKLEGTSKSGSIKLKKTDKKIIALKKNGKNKWKISLKAPGTVNLIVKAGKKYKCKIKVLPYKIGKHDNKFFAHRGLANSCPENSRVALEQSMKKGFYGTNFDLWPSKPDSKGKIEFIVSHDNKLKDMTNSGGLITGTLASKILKTKVTKGNNAKKYNQKMIKMEDAIKITEKYNGHGQIEMKCNPLSHWTKEQTRELAKRLAKLKHPERYEVESMDAISLDRFRIERDALKKQNSSLKIDKIKLNLVCAELSGDVVKYPQLCVKFGFDNMPTYYGKLSQKVLKDCRGKGIGIAGYAHINEDSNLVAHKLEPMDLDYIVVPSVPWSSGK